MIATTPGWWNYVVENHGTKQRTPEPTEVFSRIKELMQEYKGSERYYKTSRGYALVAAKLEEEGFDNVEWMIIIHLTEN